VDALREQIEVLNLQLAACMTAALANTYASTQERLAPSHPYYSGSYRAVCEAVDREMLHRAECETLRHQWAAARAALLQEQAYADKLDRMLRSVRGFKE
jgi:hypothetical protein